MTKARPPAAGVSTTSGSGKPGSTGRRKVKNSCGPALRVSKEASVAVRFSPYLFEIQLSSVFQFPESSVKILRPV
jgi:hypothetical protein